MNDGKSYNEASEITVEDGLVEVRGPDGVDVNLTPEAAEETSERMLNGAMAARGQRYLTRHHKRK